MRSHTPLLLVASLISAHSFVNRSCVKRSSNYCLQMCPLFPLGTLIETLPLGIFQITKIYIIGVKTLLLAKNKGLSNLLYLQNGLLLVTEKSYFWKIETGYKGIYWIWSQFYKTKENKLKQMCVYKRLNICVVKMIITPFRVTRLFFLYDFFIFFLSCLQ